MRTHHARTAALTVAAVVCLLAARAPAQFPPITDPDANETKCQATTDKALAKLVAAQGKCVQRCLAQRRTTGGPYGGCFGPGFTDPLVTACILDPTKGATAKAQNTIDKACNNCPECYQDQSLLLCQFGDPFIDDVSSQLDVLLGNAFCSEAGGGTPTSAEARCEDTVVKSITKLWGAASKCYAKCFTNERKGRIAPGSCTPPVTDPATIACITDPTRGAWAKASAKIEKACDPALNPANQRPACHLHTGPTWAIFTQAAVDVRSAAHWCDSEAPVPVCCSSIYDDGCFSADRPSACRNAEGIPFPDGVCDATQTCQGAPGTPGGCCEAFLQCSMLDVTSCASMGGSAWVPNAVCGASGECIQSDTKLVFVSSFDFAGNGGGVAGADSLCASAASSMGIPGTFKAWLSDGSGSAAARLTHATVPYKRADGVTVADDWTDLTDGTLDAPIDRDIFGSPVGSVEVFTSTLEDGSGVEFDCDDWTNAGGASVVGLSSATASGWSADDLASCATPRPVYCLQQ